MSEQNKLSESSRDGKLKLLGIPEDKMDYFTDVAVNVMYDNLIAAKMELKNRETLLKILNLVLKDLEKDQIYKINDFELSRTELKKFNAIEFVEVNIQKLMKYKISKKDIKYNHRKFIKGYYYTLLKSIVNYFGFNLETRKRNDINKKQIICYYCAKDF